MSNMKPPTFAQLDHLSEVGAKRAAAGLSQLLDRNISVTTNHAATGGIAEMYELLGGEDARVAGIYLVMTGDLSGHIMLLFPERNALDMVDLLLEQPPGTSQEFDEMALSALGEVGNITAAAFLNTYSDNTGLTIHPSPPVPVLEMASALVNTLLVEVAATGGELGMIETLFRDAESLAKGVVLIAPSGAAAQERGAA